MQAENPTSTTELKPTRASFIRSLPESMPVEEVIERGREVGLSIQPSDIHSVRYYMRQEAAAAPIAPVRRFMQPRPMKVPTVHGEAKNGAAAKTSNANGVAVSKQTTFDVPGMEERAERTRAERSRAERPQAERLRAERPQAERPMKTLDPRKLAKPVKVSGPLEQQLHTLVMRLGTDRARAIIEKLERTKI